MKKLSYILVIFIGIVIIGCESNDPLRDLSVLGKQVANIYFIPIEPIADANSEVDCEIEYWTVGNEIKSQSLWDKIYLTEEFDFELKDINYTYKNTFDTLQSDYEMYKEYDFDFTDWSPDKNAYVFKTKYLVDGGYAKKTYKQSDTDKETFAGLFSVEVLEKFHSSLINNKSILKNILVDNNAKVSIDIFNSWYNANGMTDEGLLAAKNYLLEINIADLIGDKYKKIESYKIYLRFKITNGFDEENESSSRSFKVK
jgi:hypothetical protein